MRILLLLPSSATANSVVGIADYSYRPLIIFHVREPKRKLGQFFSAQDYAARYDGVEKAVAHINQRLAETY